MCAEWGVPVESAGAVLGQATEGALDLGTQRLADPLRYADVGLRCVWQCRGCRGAFFKPSSSPRWRDACLAGVDGVAVSPVLACGDEGCVTEAPGEMQGSLSGMGWQDTLNQVDTHRSLVAPAGDCSLPNEDAIAKAKTPKSGDVCHHGCQRHLSDLF